MKRAAIALVATVTGLVLLLTFKTTHGNRAGGIAAVSPAAPGPTTTSPPTRHPTGNGHSGNGHSTGNGGARTIDGTTIETPYGPVQVRITMTNGTLTDIKPLQLPHDASTSQELSAYAAPILRNEALAAKSAHIQIAGGATYTSDGYAQSLQSALDKANG